MGQAIGLYFRGLDKEGVNALRARLNRLAGEFGFTARAGPTTGEGNLAALLIAVGEGKAVIVPVDTDTIQQTIDRLDGYSVGTDEADVNLKRFRNALEQSQE